MNERRPEQSEAEELLSTMEKGGRESPEFAAKEDLARFPKIDLITVDGGFGGWKKAQATHFADGGVFDQIVKALH